MWKSLISLTILPDLILSLLWLQNAVGAGDKASVKPQRLLSGGIPAGQQTMRRDAL